MQVPINIPLPVLVSGQSFKVEYSTDAINWTLDGYFTTNQFVTNYSGFVAGTQYYFRISLVLNLSPQVECDPVIIPFFASEDITCYAFSTELIENNGLWLIEVTYSIPSPYVAPCSFEVKYGTSLPLINTINYTVLPSSPFTIPTTQGTNYIEVYAVDCQGNKKLCYSQEVPYEEAECTPATISSTSINFNSGYKLNIVIVPSNPASSTYTVAYSQCDTTISGIADPGGVVNINATGQNPQTISIPITPNFNVPQDNPTYCGTITDGCGNTIYFSVSLS